MKQTIFFIGIISLLTGCNESPIEDVSKRSISNYLSEVLGDQRVGSYYLCISLNTVNQKECLVYENSDLYELFGRPKGWTVDQYIKQMSKILLNNESINLNDEQTNIVEGSILSEDNIETNKDVIDSLISSGFRFDAHRNQYVQRGKGLNQHDKLILIQYLFTHEYLVWRDDYSGLIIIEKYK